MIKRFCLYGFLKSQQYYDPFLILAFREKGLAFATIGLLIGFREICTNVLEIPTGAVADVAGRRRSMIFSMLGYIVAFAVFGLSSELWTLFAAMLFFAVGEAFRPGTHKAMIIDWLTRQGRADEKTRVYGYTRSWSKLGSALSVIIAAVLVFTMRRYSYVFLFSIGPYLANIVNFLTYPRYLDGPRREALHIRGVFRILWEALHDGVRNCPLRRLFGESMGFEGGYKVTQIYLQPVLKAAALSLPVLLALADRQRTAVIVAVVYFVLYIASSFASRHSHLFVERAGSEAGGARKLWGMNLAAFAVITAGLALDWMWLAIGGFVALSIIQNFWRPLQVSRFTGAAASERTATVLSIESQGKALFAAVAAPLLGWMVDLMPTDVRFLPVGVLGCVIAAAALLAGRRRLPAAATPEG
ncbi:MAG: MFS transporter [Planctomycetota bacterium]